MTAIARLVGDIGGTNARFALLGADNKPYCRRTYVAAEHPSLADALWHFLNDVAPEQPRTAGIAVATRVLGDTVCFTNNERWSFSTSELKADFGFDTLHVVNDFTALALSVPHLPEASLRKIGGGTIDLHEPIGIVGPGTGLGVSALIPREDSRNWTALKSEGGHNAASASNDRELAVLSVFIKRFGHVSFERFLSGPGLVNIYSALCEIDGFRPQLYNPSSITQHGIANTDPMCVEAMDVFCGLLGSFAGDLALTLGAYGGVYVGGGIVPRFGDYFESSAFRRRFESKGRLRDEVEIIPTFVIHDPYPGLTGVATLL